MTPPSLEFRGQPFDNDGSVGEVLRRLLLDDEVERITVVVAWARLRGLGRLREELAAFKARATSTIILGIDEGGATRPGLLAARAYFSEAFVYHDPAPGTFHPKLYLAEGPSKAVLLVGSNNATPGGLFLNYEASLEAEFSLPSEAGEPALLGAQAYVHQLRDDEEVCLTITDDLIERLASSGRYRVSPNERRAPGMVASVPSGADDDDVDQDDAPVDTASADEAIFGKTRYPRSSVPPLPGEAAEELASWELEVEPDEGDPAEGAVTASTVSTPPPPTLAPQVPSSPSGSGGATSVVATWSKVLPAGDAQQQPNPATNPTGNLRLTQAGHQIDWRTYFRQTLFASAAWTPGTDSHGNAIESAVVPILVTVNGTSLGVLTFNISHAKHRESGQSNHTTVLHWGPLMSALRTTDYTGYTVTLSRLNDGTYTLDISP